MNNMESMEEKNVNNSVNSSDAENAQSINSALMCQILKNLGCEPRVSDNILWVKYKDVDFCMQFGGAWVTILDREWETISEEDPRLSAYKDAVNQVNSYGSPPVFWGTATYEDDAFALNSVGSIVLHPALPDIESYVESVLDSFIEKRRNFRFEFETFCCYDT